MVRRIEKDAMAGTLFFNAAHYALRPWPWIILALSPMIVFPRLDDIAGAFLTLGVRLRVVTRDEGDLDLSRRGDVAASRRSSGVSR